MKRSTFIVAIFILFISFTVPVIAQAPQGGDANATRGQGFPGGRGMQMDPEQMQKMMSDRLKELLGMNDDEYKVIGPKITKVLSLSRQSRGNPGRMLMGRPGSQGRPNMRRQMPGNLQPGAADESMQELQKLLDDKNTPTSKIKDQVTKVRKAREKDQQESAKAKKELRELLTVKQEATLISMGLLE